jgi:prepilin-type processing-associated H-X9-DG protein
MSNVPEMTAPPPPQPKTCGLAIASLICGIVGFCTLGLSALVGLVLGIVAILKIKKSLGQIKGMGLAIAGVVVSGFVIVLIPVMIAILLPAVFGAVDLAYCAASAANLTQINLMTHEYATDHNGQLPDANHWPDLLQPHNTTPIRLLVADPAAQMAGGRIVAMNAKLSGVSLQSIRDPGRTVLFFECADGAPPAGGPGNLPPKPHHGRIFNICFADGHVEAMSPEACKNLKWEP